MSGIKNQILSMVANVKIAKRSWVPDSKGMEVAPDGSRGRYAPWEKQEVHNLLTDAGRDFLHQQGYKTTGLGANGGNYIALSTDTNGVADAHTTLAGEITNGGLTRAQGTVTHSNGETTSTVVKTFTASATHTAVQLCGLLTAASTGTLVHEATFTSVNLENNDQLQVTWTITIDD